MKKTKEIKKAFKRIKKNTNTNKEFYCEVKKYLIKEDLDTIRAQIIECRGKLSFSDSMSIASIIFAIVAICMSVIVALFPELSVENIEIGLFYIRWWSVFSIVILLLIWIKMVYDLIEEKDNRYLLCILEEIEQEHILLTNRNTDWEL